MRLYVTGKKKKEYPDLDILEDSIEEEVMEDQPVMVKISPRISFREFFQKKVAMGSIQAWEDKTLYMFFITRGLSDFEEQDLFEQMFQIY